MDTCCGPLWYFTTGAVVGRYDRLLLPFQPNAVPGIAIVTVPLGAIEVAIEDERSRKKEGRRAPAGADLNRMEEP